jgi:dihydrofolate synthase/folylpolyglutamate synthase
MHQSLNAAAAVKTLQVFTHRGGMTVSDRAVAEGTAVTGIPGRIETLPTSPRVILDGGHNVESVTALTRFLAARSLGNLTLVFGVLADKNYRRMIRLLLPYIGRVVLTQPLSERALAPGKLTRLFQNHRGAEAVLIRNRPEDAYRTARRFGSDILITGSFYLVGMMRQMIINQSYITPKSGGSDGSINK